MREQREVWYGEAPRVRLRDGEMCVCMYVCMYVTTDMRAWCVRACVGSACDARCDGIPGAYDDGVVCGRSIVIVVVIVPLLESDGEPVYADATEVAVWVIGYDAGDRGWG